MRFTHLLLPLTLVFAAACSSETPSKGSAPAIRDLKATPTAIPVGKATTVNMQFVFEDADADVNDAKVEVVRADGSKQTVPAGGGAGQASGNKAGQLMLLLAIQPPAAEKLTVNVWVVDQKGNESNRLAVSIDAQ
jgi:ethanolamine utilization microcompartment shell protein EutL